MYFLPTPYPGELWYSTLCRYHQRSGNVAEIHSIEELFGCRTHLPTVELPSYLDDILAGTDISPEQIMLQHSIYPYYARFLSVPKKESILQRCRDGALTPTTCGQFRQVLKFCPQCAAEQRETYGEAYWVAYQQVRELAVCPIHNVRLQNSPYPVHSGQNPHFHPLNLADTPIQNEDKLQFNLSKMIFDCAFLRLHLGISAAPPKISNLRGRFLCLKREKRTDFAVCYFSVQSVLSNCCGVLSSCPNSERVRIAITSSMV